MTITNILNGTSQALFAPEVIDQALLESAVKEHGADMEDEGVEANIELLPWISMQIILAR